MNIEEGFEFLRDTYIDSEVTAGEMVDYMRDNGELVGIPEESIIMFLEWDDEEL